MLIKRKTIQRALVLEAVNKLQCHATVEEIYQMVASEHPNISKGTVYRNLNQLADSGEIRKLEIPGGADRFDHRCHNHYHVKCLKCGRVFDVDMEYIADLEQKNQGYPRLCVQRSRPGLQRSLSRLQGLARNSVGKSAYAGA